MLSLIMTLLEIVRHHGLTQAIFSMATQIREEQSAPEFTISERDILLRFFSNTDRNTFLVFGMPEELVSVLLAMYSRIQDPRGIRGVFLELIKEIPLVGDMFMDPEGIIDIYGEKKLLDLTSQELSKYIGMGIDPEHYLEVVTAKRIRKFLSMWLDKFGHNSIARTAIVHVCCEKISTLAAKALEETRPAAGYIELSTRFVIMNAKDGLYPFWKLCGKHEDEVKQLLTDMFTEYKQWLNKCEKHWAELWPKQCQRTKPNKATLAVTGKQGDSLGNLLACALLTSVGFSVSAESLPGVIRHLYEDGTAECIVLAQEIEKELKRFGSSIFLRHHQPNRYAMTIGGTRYLPLSRGKQPGKRNVRVISITSSKKALEAIQAMEGLLSPTAIRKYWVGIRNRFKGLASSHLSFDKLPRGFEAVIIAFAGFISFRTWRELQRHVFLTHRRSLVKPGRGIYIPADMPPGYKKASRNLYNKSATLWHILRKAGHTPAMLQYIMPMGTIIAYTVAMNLRQFEFLTWQRSGRYVHHEIRGIILEMDRLASKIYKWWKGISRTNRISDYIFARGDANEPASPDRP